MFPLAAGLFVGINNYPSLKGERQLNGAALDALRLYEYFVSSSSTAVADVAVETGVWRPTRANLLAKFVHFLAKVPPGKAGIFYFAGHGFSIQDGLVLAPQDFVARQGWDTGIPLRRLLELTKRHRKKKAKYVFLIDCCRSGTSSGMEDDIPPNVTLVCACAQGSFAFEHPDGGFLASAMFSAAAKLLAGAKANNCGLHTFLEATQEQYVRLAGGRTVALEIVGSKPDLIQWPLSVMDSAVEIAANRVPSIYLCGSLAEEPEPEIVAGNIRTAIRLWLGLRLDAPTLDAIIDNIFFRKADSNDVVVAIRSLGPAAPGFALLHELLNGFATLFDVMRLEWSGRVAEQQFRVVFGQLANCSWMDSPDNNLGVRWTNSNGLLVTQGQGWWLEMSEGRTVFQFECVNPEGERLPLSFLHPTVVSVVNLLSAVLVEGPQT